MSKGGPPQKKARVSTKEQEEQEKIWREAFELFDIDHNGKVSQAELSKLLRAFQMNPSQKEVAEVLRKLDKNNSGYVEYEEFESYMRQLKTSVEKEVEDMLRAFMIFDHNGDGRIDVSELMKVLVNLGEPLSQEEASKMLAVADLNQDGKLDYTEFVKFIMAPCL